MPRPKKTDATPKPALAVAAKKATKTRAAKEHVRESARREDVVRVNLEVDPKVRRDLKILAAKEGKTIRQLVEDALAATYGIKAR